MRSTIVAVLFCSAVTARAPAAEGDVAKDIRPLLTKYCVECHGSRKPKGDLDLASFVDESSVLAARKTWKKVLDALHAREMPPEGKPQPTIAERNRMTDWLEPALARPDADGRRNPGPPVVRRLTRAEYNNTIFDLFNLQRPRTYFDPVKGLPEEIRLVIFRNQRPAVVDLPADDIDQGYANVCETLSLPPFLMEKYLTAAREVADLAAAQKSRIFATRPDQKTSRESAKAAISDLAKRAFRRSVTTQEVDRLLKLFDLATEKGEPYANALKVPIQAILASPHFLLRTEIGDPDRDEKGVRPLTDHELASRLSYFVWSSTPDAELLALADQGKLRDPKVLEAQAHRMLRNPRAKELAENFGLQWLQLENLGGAAPDPDRFPKFYKLRYIPLAMRQEALLLFEAVMIEDRSIFDLIDPGFTFLNGEMAKFYGIDGPHVNVQNSGLFWLRYPLADKRRGGVLTLAGVLTTTSISTRTSPVKRGKWVLETLLGAPPPPPLANVADLDAANPAVDGLSLRQKLERHRSDANCASCHARMDPIGLGLENFNAIGEWREKDGPHPIDASSRLSDGTTFSGPVELKRLLTTTRKDDFVRCLTGHLLTYALGRKPEYYDAIALRQIGEALSRGEYKFSALVAEIVKSEPFRLIRATEAKPR